MMIVFSIQALSATNSDKGLKDNNRENSEDKHHTSNNILPL